MKKFYISTFSVLLISLALNIAALETAHAKPGLLIIAHGSPMPEWNQPVIELGEKVAAQVEKNGRFSAVRTVFLEFAEPDIVWGVTELENAGCDRIIAIPLFIAPSSHTHFDVPAVLGLYTSAEIKSIIADEGGRIAKPKVPITLTHTLDESDLLQRFALDEVRLLSKNPDDEAIIVIMHGCDDHDNLVTRKALRVASFCCGKTGINYADWGFAAVGQTYFEECMPAIINASNEKEKVIVLGLYVSSSADDIHNRAMSMANDMFSKMMKEALKDKSIVFSTNNLVNYPPTLQWVINTAENALN